MELWNSDLNGSFSLCTLDVYFSNVTSCYVNYITVWSKKIMEMARVHFNERGALNLETAEGCKNVTLLFVHDVMHVN